ncbi:hypothetical protein C5B42_05265 [Candidatus Cerribacteria bacterium 'Amazon FNV 2010 28 9']|uniref:Uncharacterized protein n=1 Tax=Candidatus Cerribacteria bacterium 'Amazon FNV 2010 28 9' TaxID=2081795 RepID=A0A317JM68_9BACT|nr:MAG: hypothetical protein C5B42_05265 [Candidatus Cerribacteria bacterium 'Amazon FNV 2010 28 9']
MAIPEEISSYTEEERAFDNTTLDSYELDDSWQMEQIRAIIGPLYRSLFNLRDDQRTQHLQDWLSPKPTLPNNAFALAFYKINMDDLYRVLINWERTTSPFIALRVLLGNERYMQFLEFIYTSLAVQQKWTDFEEINKKQRQQITDQERGIDSGLVIPRY